MPRWPGGWSFNEVARAGALVTACATLANCSSSDRIVDPRYGVAASPRVVQPGEPVPKGGGAYRIGRPYVVGGRTYVPAENKLYRSEGLASWYGPDFHGRLTANGEVYDADGISAAHPTLPMPSYVRVTNLANQRSLIVRVNDRGPYSTKREIDLSGRAAELLGYRHRGVARVRVEYVGAAPLEGSDDRRLAATLREGTPAPAPSLVMIASARPVLPESASRTLVMRGSVPAPPPRPFDLGLDADATTPSAPYAAAASRSAQGRGTLPAEMTASASAGTQPWSQVPQSSLVSPMSAYAPARSDGPGAVSSGRGLY
jgi:rare lipoprotein A